MITLDEFITRVRHKTRDREWVLEPKFESLYVRYGRRYIAGAYQTDVLDIANVTVEEKHRGTGVFTALVDRLRQTYPGMGIYVESAAPEFKPLLLRLMFTEVLNDSFFLKGDDVVSLKEIDLIEKSCAVSAFGIQLLVRKDGRERGLWFWIKPRDDDPDIDQGKRPVEAAALLEWADMKAVYKAIGKELARIRRIDRRKHFLKIDNKRRRSKR